MKKFLSINVLLICFFTIRAQKFWTLEECINYAYEHNISIKQQQLKIAASQNVLWQSRLNLLPSVNASATQNFSFGRSVDRYTNTFLTDHVKSNTFSLSSSLTLFDGFQNINAIKQSRYNLNAALQNIETLKNNIALTIASAYLQILFNEELVTNAQNQLSITIQQVEKTRQLVNAGSLAQGALLDMEAQQATDELAVVNAQNELLISYVTLTQYLDLDSVENFKIVNPDFSTIIPQTILLTVDQIYAEALLNMPQIKSSEYEVKSSQCNLAIVRGRRSPQLTFSAAYGTGYSDARKIITDNKLIGEQVLGYTKPSYETVYTPAYEYIYSTYKFADQFKDNQNKAIYFSLIIPIFNNFQVNYAISNAKINVQNAEYILDLQKQTLHKEIQQAHADATAAYNKYIATKKTVTALEEAFRYTEQKFNLGLLTAVDYNLAKNKLSEAKSNLLQAKYSYIFKTKILDFYRGTAIKL